MRMRLDPLDLKETNVQAQESPQLRATSRGFNSTYAQCRIVKARDLHLLSSLNETFLGQRFTAIRRDANPTNGAQRCFRHAQRSNGHA